MEGELEVNGEEVRTEGEQCSWVSAVFSRTCLVYDLLLVIFENF